MSPRDQRPTVADVRDLARNQVRAGEHADDRTTKDALTSLLDHFAADVDPGNPRSSWYELELGPLRTARDLLAASLATTPPNPVDVNLALGLQANAAAVLTVNDTLDRIARALEALAAPEA